MTASRADMPRRRGLLGAFTVAATVVGGLVGVAVMSGGPAPDGAVLPSVRAGSSAPATPSPTSDITFDPVRPTALPTIAGDRTARIGERVVISDEVGDRLGWVRVTEAVKYTSLRGLDAPSRFMWVGARVEYVADAGLAYADLDWVAHDDGGTRYEPTAFARDPSLGLGTLEPGQSIAGWIAFEVPRDVGHLWAAFVNLDGGVVFGVPLF